MISDRYFYIKNFKIECKEATPKNELTQKAITTIFKEEYQDKKIFVGGLDTQIDDSMIFFILETLKEYCEQFGEVIEALIMREKESKMSKGYGFVIFKFDKTVNEIINYGKTIGHQLNGKVFECKAAIKKEILEEKNTYSTSKTVNSIKKSKKSSIKEELINESTFNSSEKLGSYTNLNTMTEDNQFNNNNLYNLSFQSANTNMYPYSINPYLSPNYINYCYPPNFYPFIFNSSNSININNNFLSKQFNIIDAKENQLSSNFANYISSKNINPMNYNLNNNDKDVKKKKKKKIKKTTKSKFKNSSEVLNKENQHLKDNLFVEKTLLKVPKSEDINCFDDIELSKFIDELKNGKLI